MLDSKDVEILLVLQKNPLATLSQIANEINLSVSNTSARIEKLEKDNLIFQGVHVDLNLKSLELEILDFFLEVKSKKALHILEEKFSHFHPYLLYRGRCNGKINGLYTQFRVPKKGLAYIEKLLEKLQTNELISNYKLVKRNQMEKPIRIKSSLNSWDSKNQRWNFNWENWKKRFYDAPETKNNDFGKSPSILTELSELDIKLLSELTMDSRQKNVEMMRKIGLQNESGIAQKVSRRLKFLKEKAISDYRIFLHWSKFDLYQSICIKGQCEDKLAFKIKNHLKEGNENWDKNSSYFPFQGVYFITDEGFFWYVRAPPSHLSKYLDFVWEICPEHELYFLDYKYSQIYGLWDQTFDVEKKRWKLNEQFMIDNVMNQMLKK